MTALSSPARRTVEVNEFGVDVAYHDAPPVVRVRGEVDLYTAPLMEQQLQQLVADGAREIVVDLAKVTFLDAAGLGALVRTMSRLRRRHGGMQVRSPSPRVQKTFEITGLDQIFTILDERDSAVAALDGAS